MTSASEQTSASKRDERYITAPSGKRITESEWMNGGDPEWTDEFKQKTFDNFHRQEFTSPQQQPDTPEEYKHMVRIVVFDKKIDVTCQRCGSHNVISLPITIQPQGQPDELSDARERCKELEKTLQLYTNLLAKAQEKIEQLTSK